VALRLLSDPGIFEDLTPLLSELTMPTRLIVGEADLVTSPSQVEEFTRRVGPQEVEVFERASHFVQGEQPERYARFVLGFIAEVERQRY
jgi:pimeloyl-ACP methyl ester carboxylesterase